MYYNYEKFIEESSNDILSKFKSNNKYRGILEHVSKMHGLEYLELIVKEFPKIEKENIIEFCKINDSIGEPIKSTISSKGFTITCSPSSLRYIYHALIILNHYNKSGCENIVEVGCGYGGLCLSINFFKDKMDIEINNYNIIDLKEPLSLIKKYLSEHKPIVTTNVLYHESSTYGKEVDNNKLFFISNYCYTELESHHNLLYTETLLVNAMGGFLVWQNGGNKGSYPIEDSKSITNKTELYFTEERPQTDSGYGIYKNYFAYF